MATTCSECTYLNIEGEFCYGQFYCTKIGEWKYATEEKCYRYCRAYGTSDSKMKEAYRRSEESQKPSGPCYITTALCDILHMPDDNENLQTLRKFRKNYLQKNERGLKILVKYDEVGPQISEQLYASSGKLNMALILFQNYIEPITTMIKANKYDDAISSYTEMTNKLIKFFNIDDTVHTKIEEVVPELSGHGQLVKKTAVKSLA